MVYTRLPIDPMYAVCDDALDAEGYVVTLDPTTGHVKLATSNDKPFGIAMTSTKNPITNEPEAGVEVAILPIRSGFVAKVKKKTGTGTAITKGDFVAVSDVAGVVEKTTPPTQIPIDTTNAVMDPTPIFDWLKKVVGIAVADASDSDEYVLVHLIGV